MKYVNFLSITTVFTCINACASHMDFYDMKNNSRKALYYKEKTIEDLEEIINVSLYNEGHLEIIGLQAY